MEALCQCRPSVLPSLTKFEVGIFNPTGTSRQVCPITYFPTGNQDYSYIPEDFNKDLIYDKDIPIKAKEKKTTTESETNRLSTFLRPLVIAVLFVIISVTVSMYQRFRFNFSVCSLGMYWKNQRIQFHCASGSNKKYWKPNKYLAGTRI